VVGVETGMATFMNHGCNGTYNTGLALARTEATLERGDGPLSAGYWSDQRRYDPFSAREFPYFRCQHSCVTLRAVRAGEELLTNYLVFGGNDPGTLWEDTLAEVKAMCSGTELGLVQFYESTATTPATSSTTATATTTTQPGEVVPPLRQQQLTDQSPSPSPTAEFADLLSSTLLDS
jgi:hypothetical protein